MRKIESLEQFIKEFDNSSSQYIFGAGVYANIITSVCKRNSILIDNVIVTEKGELSDFNGIEIISLSSVMNLPCEDRSIVVAIAKSDRIVESIEDTKCFKKIFVCSEQLMLEIMEYRWLRYENIKPLGCSIDIRYPGIEQDFAILRDCEDGIPLARIHCTCDIEKISEKATLKDKRNKTYGEMKYIESDNEFGFTESDVRSLMYVVASRKDLKNIKYKLPSGYEIIQVGVTGADSDLACISDSDGENISNENYLYSECTAHYWIWKNDSMHKYVGVNHYRRTQHINDVALGHIKDDNIDVVLPMMQYTGIPFKDFYLKYSTNEEWKALAYSIHKEWNEYTDVLQEFSENNIYFPCNILFAKKEAFDDYCRFMFANTFRIRQWFKSHNNNENAQDILGI